MRGSLRGGCRFFRCEGHARVVTRVFDFDHLCSAISTLFCQFPVCTIRFGSSAPQMSRNWSQVYDLSYGLNAFGALPGNTCTLKLCDPSTTQCPSTSIIKRHFWRSCEFQDSFRANSNFMFSCLRPRSRAMDSPFLLKATHAFLILFSLRSPTQNSFRPTHICELSACVTISKKTPIVTSVSHFTITSRVSSEHPAQGEIAKNLLTSTSSVI